MDGTGVISCCTLRVMDDQLYIGYVHRQLSVYRIRLHKMLFVSILLNSIFVITFKTVAILPSLDPTSPLKDYVKQVFVFSQYITIRQAQRRDAESNRITQSATERAGLPPSPHIDQIFPTHQLHVDVRILSNAINI